MSDLPPLPKSLEAWEGELRFFARDLLGSLAPMSERLLQALGPLRVANERQSDEPNGYSALSRRGPYERLLASEWALQLEEPDEFIRRSSTGEHLFLELERRSPAASFEAWVLFDTSPAVLGSPRIGHLAALIAFARRARDARIALRWAPLWNWERPVHERLDPASVREWLDARIAWLPTTGLLSQWSSRWPVDEKNPVDREVWVIGAPELAPLAREHGWGVVTFEEQSDALEVLVTPARRIRPTVVRLALPPMETRVKLLRDPLERIRVKAPSRPAGPGAVPLEPSTDLAFSHDSHRLLARLADGGVVAIPVRNTVNSGYGWPTLAVLPPLAKVIAVMWASRRVRAYVATIGEQLALYDWDGRLLRHINRREPLEHPRAHELFVGTTTLPFGWVRRGSWFDLEGKTEQHVVAAAFGTNVLGLRVKPLANVHVVPSDTHRPGERWLHIAERPQRAVVGTSPYGLAAFAMLGDRVEILTGRAEQGPIQTRALPSALFAQEDVFAIGVEEAGPRVFALSADRKVIRSLSCHQVASQWEEETRARAAIERATLSVNGELLAWRDVNGQLGVYTRKRRQVVLRLHVSDVSREEP